MGQQPPGQEPPGQQPPPMQPPPGGAEPSPSSGGGASYVAASGAGLRATDWWKRLVALIIDSLVVGIPASILGTLLFGGMFAVSTDPVTGLPNAGFMATYLATVGAFMLASILLGVAYYVYFHGSRGQTVGKMAMKIKVVDEATGGPISYGTAFVRYLIPGLASWLCGLIALIDGLWPLWDAKGQALHDKVAKTLVIDV